jgi:hypothetical protein
VSAAERPIVVTGVARSGSTLLSVALSAHPEVMVAADPFLPLFRELRRDLIARGADVAAAAAFDPAGPIHDGYFDSAALAHMDAVHRGDLDAPLHPATLERVVAACAERARHHSPDLADRMDRLAPAATWREALCNGLDLIGAVRGAGGRSRLGFKDLWIIDFFPALARALPEARFLVLMRDPRAVIHSLQALGRRDPSQAGHVLSYLRHWRRQVACVEEFQRRSELSGRVHLLRLEDLLEDPAATLRGVCDFLQITLHPAMLDADGYRDHGAGAPWRGNSSFVPATRGLDRARGGHWRGGLGEGLCRTVEFACGAEMEALGYAREHVSDGAALDPRVLATLLEQDAAPCAWRSATGDVVREAGAESVRNALLAWLEPARDNRLIRSCFLFERAYLALRRGAGARGGSGRSGRATAIPAVPS